jgi:hypothetical protein
LLRGHDIVSWNTSLYILVHAMPGRLKLWVIRFLALINLPISSWCIYSFANKLSGIKNVVPHLYAW